MKQLVGFLLTVLGIFCMLCVAFTAYAISLFIFPGIDTFVRMMIALLTMGGVSAIACFLLWLEEKY